jgi:hypothetical protein
LAVGSWQLAVGSWQLAVGSWQLAVQDKPVKFGSFFDLGNNMSLNTISKIYQALHSPITAAQRLNLSVPANFTQLQMLPGISKTNSRQLPTAYCLLKTAN